MKGQGIFSPKFDFTNKMKSVLDKYGDKKIVSINIARRPIANLIEKAFNVISLGKWEKLRKEYYYDKLFHLSLQLTLEDGKILALEKFDVVSLSVDKRCDLSNVDCMNVAYPKNKGGQLVCEDDEYSSGDKCYKKQKRSIKFDRKKYDLMNNPINPKKIEKKIEKDTRLTVNQLVKDPLNSMTKEEYFVYDPFKKNCQLFVSKILSHFGLLNKKSKDFIYQDIGEIIKRLPFYVKWTAKAFTDVSAFSKKIRGSGCGCESCLKGGCDSCMKCPLINTEINSDNQDLKKLSKLVIDMLN